MTVKERILLSKLSLKIEDMAEYAKKIGIYISDTALSDFVDKETVCKGEKNHDD
jgi:hypothetical protein